MTEYKIEETGGELTTIPNEKYAKFFAKFAEIDTLDVSQWKAAHLLGYFCRKYKEAYGVEYQWKFNNPLPSKCFEVWQFNTLCAKLSANPKILKEYIDWAFANLVPKAKRRLTSISFITKDDVLIPYKMNVLLGVKKDPEINRSTPLPQQYQDIIQKFAGVDITTYGDLAFMSQMDQPTNDILKNLVKIGFDIDVLKRIV